MKTVFFLLLCFTGYGQYDHQSVFPDLDGEVLFDALRSSYKPQIVLELSEARDTLYRKIHLHQDSVRCVYTGLSKFLDLTADPSQALFEGGGNADINLEHSYPQAKGAGDGNPRSDMHHLFPTRVPVNSARGNDPMMELPDNQTTAWYFNDETRGNPPTTGRESWSEDTNFGFEPREDFKGNIARAYFYFYTMYKEEADFDDPDFFGAQQEIMCDWHELDPVDSLEWVRTFKIAEYQDGKVNPFVLDCRLARYYCDEIAADCRTVKTSETEEPSISKLYPNVSPSGGVIKVNELKESALVEIYNLAGQLLFVKENRNLIAPDKPGVYLVKWLKQGHIHSGRLIVH